MNFTAQKTSSLTPLDFVRVCASCFRASCAQDVFPCSDRGRFGTVAREDLEYLGHELSEFWTREFAERNTPAPSPVTETVPR